MSELRKDFGDVASVEVEKDGCKCVLFRWYSENMGEWFTSMTVTYQDGMMMRSSMSVIPCTEKAAYDSIDAAIALREIRFEEEE